MMQRNSDKAGHGKNTLGLKRPLRYAAFGVALMTMATPQSWAWGREGHRLTALVAEHYLTPAAREEIAELLSADSNGKETLADIAPWADEYRLQHPETGPWHYVDIPKSAATFDRDRDCPASASDPKAPWRDCVTDRIMYFEGRLGDTSLSLKERAIALKFIVHFIGDIHQPFHAMGDDRGGNGISVAFLGSSQCGSYKCNLHGVWDDSMIEEQGLSEKKYTEKLIQEIADHHWERIGGGSPVAWANASHHYAVEAYAPNGALLTHEYVNEKSQIVDAELAVGGLRLAHVLNRILGTPDTPPDAQPGRTVLPKPAAEVPAAPAHPGATEAPKN
ncbi:MAG: S1/P1 nuclease [Acidobacteriota bacterium]